MRYNPTNKFNGRRWPQGIIALFLLLIGHAGQCGIINVPHDYSSIDNAVMAASDGDVIIVAPGIYHDGIDYLNKNIIIKSTFNGDWSIVRNTIIDADNQAGVVYFHGNEGTSCTLRGFTIRNGHPGIGGNHSHATIEYNLIINNNNNSSSGGSNDPLAGAIDGFDGIIQNNIIMNNYGVKGGAIANCNGIIRNNVISHNTGEKCFVYRPPVSGGSYWIPGVGGAFYNCQASILNNTIADNYLDNGNGLIAGGFSKCTGPITNNIIYHTTMTTTLEYDQCSTPTYCLFRAPRAGQGNISGDPLFVNPAQGDYHLQSGSPAIGAGQAINGVKADLDGHQRGLNMITGRGDGSGMDIGAYEALPKPVAVWLQNGAPDQLAEGQQLAVGWQMDLTTGGTAIDLRLVQGGMVVKDYGKFWNPGGADITTITLPKPLISLADYRIEGRSSYDMSLTFDTPPFAIQGSGKSAAGLVWSQYL